MLSSPRSKSSNPEKNLPAAGLAGRSESLHLFHHSLFPQVCVEHLLGVLFLFLFFKILFIYS